MKAQKLLEQLSKISDDTTIKVSIESSMSTDELELLIEDTDIDDERKTIFLQIMISVLLETLSN